MSNSGLPYVPIPKRLSAIPAVGLVVSILIAVISYFLKVEEIGTVIMLVIFSITLYVVMILYFGSLATILIRTQEDKIIPGIQFLTCKVDTMGKSVGSNTYPLPNREAVYKKATEITKNAGKTERSRTIWCLEEEKPYEEYLMALEERITNGGIVYRLVNLRFPVIRDTAKDLFEKFNNYSNFELRHTDQQYSEVLMSDTEALVTFPAEDKAEVNTALYTNDPEFITALRTWYSTYLYNPATPIKSITDIDKYIK